MTITHPEQQFETAYLGGTARSLASTFCIVSLTFTWATCFVRTAVLEFVPTVPVSLKVTGSSCFKLVGMFMQEFPQGLRLDRTETFGIALKHS